MKISLKEVPPSNKVELNFKKGKRHTRSTPFIILYSEIKPPNKMIFLSAAAMQIHCLSNPSTIIQILPVTWFIYRSRFAVMHVWLHHSV
jgi:hypothetical protein